MSTERSKETRSEPAAISGHARLPWRPPLLLSHAAADVAACGLKNLADHGGLIDVKLWDVGLSLSCLSIVGVFAVAAAVDERAGRGALELAAVTLVAALGWQAVAAPTYNVGTDSVAEIRCRNLALFGMFAAYTYIPSALIRHLVGRKENRLRISIADALALTALFAVLAALIRFLPDRVEALPILMQLTPFVLLSWSTSWIAAAQRRRLLAEVAVLVIVGGWVAFGYVFDGADVAFEYAVFSTLFAMQVWALFVMRERIRFRRVCEEDTQTDSGSIS